jgi:hypothetical protein
MDGRPGQLRYQDSFVELGSVLAGAACVAGLSVVAWILWGKYDAVAEGSHASHAEAIIGAVLAQLAIMGITSVVFGLMPFKFMDGFLFWLYFRLRRRVRPRRLRRSGSRAPWGGDGAAGTHP